jgi:hypothetical protein
MSRKSKLHTCLMTYLCCEWVFFCGKNPKKQCVKPIPGLKKSMFPEVSLRCELEKCPIGLCPLPETGAGAF